MTADKVDVTADKVHITTEKVDLTLEKSAHSKEKDALIPVEMNVIESKEEEANTVGTISKENKGENQRRKEAKSPKICKLKVAIYEPRKAVAVEFPEETKRESKNEMKRETVKPEERKKRREESLKTEKTEKKYRYDEHDHR